MLEKIIKLFLVSLCIFGTITYAIGFVITVIEGKSLLGAFFNGYMTLFLAELYINRKKK